jgi:hypothetical protein
MYKPVQQLKYLGLKDEKKLELVCLLLGFYPIHLSYFLFYYLDGPHYSRVNEGLRINRVEMGDNETFWCRADVLETGESRDFPITVIISSRMNLINYYSFVLLFN